MKTQVKVWMLLLMGSFMLASCETTGPAPEPVTLSQDEIDMIKHMREEEKLARDVYDYLYEKYSDSVAATVFDNISNSEQRHMDMVLALLIKYNIDDPASPEPGVFTIPELQELYNQLIALGEQSFLDALKVGATIEDVDIYDLANYMAQTDNDDIYETFSRLQCGSRNHMRAFYGEILNQGGDYTPQFISETEFENIINSDHERCGGN